MRVLDLFSGIGGFSLGLERAGMETVAFCEYDEKCRQVLKKHWPDVPQYNDVLTLTKEQLDNDGITDIGLICGGFPCQPYSRANHKREGRGDSRDMSGEAVRLVGELKPTVFVGENTEGFIDIGLHAFADALEEEGYFSEALSIPSCAFGLPTLERHVWIIATTSSERLQGYVKETAQALECLQGKFQRSNQGIGERWRLPESRVCRSSKGVPGGVDRLKQLGNAVPPISLEVIGRAIMEAHHA